MEISKTTTHKFSLGPKDVADIIAEYLTAKHGVTVTSKDVQFNVDGGDPGGYGSMGDPQHVYNSPTPASFQGARVEVKA